ncbi:MAG TPA: hypothetical protein VKR43_12850 [Bryobacteraceae bacterium]|nr:hypothetical protein [Bryobacteraceae bacterium]
MASHFQLQNGERFVESTSKEGIVWLHTGVSITLEFVATGSATGADARDVISDTPTVVAVSNLKKTHAKVTFTLTGKGTGVVGIKGKDGTAKPPSLVVIAGDFKNQTDMEIDLLADICRDSDPVKTLAVQRLLYNEENNLFNQLNAVNVGKFGKLGCGKVVKASGITLFDQVSEINYEQPYHEPLDAVKDRTDVRYTTKTIEKVRNAIKLILHKGIPVRVGVLDSPVGMFVQDQKLIAYYAGGHTTLIVGCDKNASEFMYIDTWPGGSQMPYEGGIVNTNFSGPCWYMGRYLAEYYYTRLVPGDKAGPPNLIRSDLTTAGSFNGFRNYLEIVSGPPVPL